MCLDDVPLIRIRVIAVTRELKVETFRAHHPVFDIRIVLVACEIFNLSISSNRSETLGASV
jgi:hypothetical protein